MSHKTEDNFLQVEQKDSQNLLGTSNEAFKVDEDESRNDDFLPNDEDTAWIDVDIEVKIIDSVCTLNTLYEIFI